MVKRKKKGISDAVYIAMIIIFLLVALVCASMLMLREYTIWKANRLYDSLAENTIVENTETAQETASAVIETEAPFSYDEKAEKLYEQYGIEVPKKRIDFAMLHESVSEDIYAWIYIPNTHIDYPVLQHPTDNTYYLKYNLDGSEGYPGCIYTENYNSKDFSDRQTIIYGHNMRDGRMFSDLHEYEKQEFFDENRYVFIYTEVGDVLVYRIFAAYQTGNAHQLLNFDFSSDEAVLRYLNNVMSLPVAPQILDRSIEFTGSENILTLSTCVMTERQYHLRYLVQAVELKTE